MTHSLLMMAAGGGEGKDVQREHGRASLAEMGYEIAPLSDRVISMIIDLIIVAVIGAVILIVAIPFSLLVNPLFFTADFSTGVLVLSIIYFIAFEWTGRQTPGKKFTGIRTVSLETLKTPDHGQVIVRNVVRIIDSFPGNLYIVGFIIAALTEKKQRLGDILAGTLMLKGEPRIVRKEE